MRRVSGTSQRVLALLGIGAAIAIAPSASRADEGGVSFWLPGQRGSFAAVPGEPGASVPLVYFHSSADANASKSFIIGGNRVAGLSANADLLFIAPTYTFTQPLAGAQAALSLVWPVDHARVSVDAVVTGQQGNTVSKSRTDSVSGGGDLYPMGTLKWKDGDNYWLAYAMGEIPTGAYQLGRLANLGANHGAIDGGGGYTYLNSTKGHEFSVVGGVTYNFENRDTNYQNGIDGHVDWALAQFLNEQALVGLVGYGYYQLTGDSGTGATLGSNKARVYAVGPQAGYFFPCGGSQGYVNLRGYWEFGAEHRPEGWNLWLTLSLPLVGSK
jgi:hypothetical protein